MNKVLVASKSDRAGRELCNCCKDLGGTQLVCGLDAFANILNNGKEAHRFEYLFIDLELIHSGVESSGLTDYHQSFQTIWRRFPGVEVIVMCPQEKIRQAVRAVKTGASDYVTYPIDSEEVKLILDTIQQQRRRQMELEYLRDAMFRRKAASVGRAKSPVMREVHRQISSVAPTRTTVLLQGETGTGKSLAAKLIHSQSNRSKGPFVSVHCGAIPDTLIESELFGHEKGAFTGADRRKLGKFEIAKGGTIFLDEVSTISQSGQIKLLQVLQEQNYSRVGGAEIIEADIRVVAATNENLATLIVQGKFRQDLFYRLNVFPIDLPPLRERVEDIPDLAQDILQRLNDVHGKGIHSFDPRVVEAFQQYAWPGNVRELQNVIERAYIIENSPILTPECFPTELVAYPSVVASGKPNEFPTLQEARRRSLDIVERQYLREILTNCRGRIEESARVAGLTSRQIPTSCINTTCAKKTLDRPAFTGNGTSFSQTKSGSSFSPFIVSDCGLL